MDFRKIVEKNKEEMFKTLQECIQFPSVEGDAKEDAPYGEAVQRCFEYMLAKSAELGFATTNLDNKVGWCEFGEGEEMIAVLGHLDVVPEGEGWDMSPYAGLIQDGRIYGRGAMDDKGPVVCALYALKALKEAGVSLNKRIRIIYGLNEETGCRDMKYYHEKGCEIPVMGFTPDGAFPLINGEKGIVIDDFERDYTQGGAIKLVEISGGTAANIVPASAYAVLSCDDASAEYILAKQVEKVTVTKVPGGVRVDAKGESAHGSTPAEGENAIGRLALFLNTLALEGDTAEIIGFIAEKFGMESDGKSLGIAMKDEVSGILVNNLGVIRGDASHVKVVVNYRYPVTKHYEDCVPIMDKAFAAAGFIKTKGRHDKALYMSADSELVKLLLDVYEKVSGLEGKAMAIGGGTYAKSMPNTLAFGPSFPGDEVREHKANEFMELSRLLDNATIYAYAMYEMAK